MWRLRLTLVPPYRAIAGRGQRPDARRGRRRGSRATRMRAQQQPQAYFASSAFGAVPLTGGAFVVAGGAAPFARGGCAPLGWTAGGRAPPPQPMRARAALDTALSASFASPSTLSTAELAVSRLPSLSSTSLVPPTSWITKPGRSPPPLAGGSSLSATVMIRSSIENGSTLETGVFDLAMFASTNSSSIFVVPPSCAWA